MVFMAIFVSPMIWTECFVFSFGEFTGIKVAVVGENLHVEVARSESKQNLPCESRDDHGCELVCRDSRLEAQSRSFYSHLSSACLLARIYGNENLALRPFRCEDDWYFARIRPPKESYRVGTSVCERSLPVEVIANDKVSALGATAG